MSVQKRVSIRRLVPDRRPISAVRVLDLPRSIAGSGVRVWISPDPVIVEGWQEVVCFRGPTGNKRGDLLLTFQQERDKPQVPPQVRADCWAFAADYFAAIGKRL